MNAIRIRDWDLHFEIAQSRKVEAMRWVPIPVKHDGLGFRRLMSMKGGVELYGAWLLIVQVAAKCPLRGTLADERGPLTSEALALKTGCPIGVFDRAFKVLCEKDIGWLEYSEYHPDTTQLPLQENTRENNTKQDSTEEESAPLCGCPPDLAPWLEWWNRLKGEGLVPVGVDVNQPSKAVLDGWKRVEKSKALRDVLRDRDAVESKIRDSRGFICDSGWFRLEKLFGGKNRAGEYIIRMLLDGAYIDKKGKSSGPRAGAGQRHDPNAKQLAPNDF